MWHGQEDRGAPTVTAHCNWQASTCDKGCGAWVHIFDIDMTVQHLDHHIKIWSELASDLACFLPALNSRIMMWFKVENGTPKWCLAQMCLVAGVWSDLESEVGPMPMAKEVRI